MGIAKTILRVSALGIWVLVAALPAGADPVYPYTITHLGTLGGPWSLGNAINEFGVVVGTSRDATGHDYGYIWHDGHMAPLPPSGSGAGDINDTGHVAGGAGASALLWCPPDYEPVDLGSLCGGFAAAYAINNAGQVVGESDNADGERHPFLWTPGGTDDVPCNPQMEDLGTLGGGGRNIAFGINDSELVVGESFNTGGEPHGFLWQRAADDGVACNPQMEDLGTLGGNESTAHAINASGQVAGRARDTDGDDRAFRITPQDVDKDGDLDWFEDAGDGKTNKLMRNLGVLQDTAASRAYGINDLGQAVGRAYGGAAGERAFLWLDGPAYGLSAGMHDLNDSIDPHSGWVLRSAVEINNAGQIVGWGHFDGAQRAFLMKPIPEPISMAFMGSAFVGLVAYRVTKRRRQVRR